MATLDPVTPECPICIPGFLAQPEDLRKAHEMRSAEQPVVFQRPVPTEMRSTLGEGPVRLEDPSPAKAGDEQPWRCCPLLAAQAQPTQPSPGSAPWAGRQRPGPGCPRGPTGQEIQPLMPQRRKPKPRFQRGGLCSRPCSKYVNPTKGVCSFEKW